MLKIQRGVYRLLFVVLSVIVLYYGKPFLIPLVLAGVLATLVVGLAQRMEQHGASRGLASFIGTLTIVCAIALIVGLITWRMKDFSDSISGMKESTLKLVENLKAWIDGTLGIPSDEQDKLIEKSNPANGDAGGMLMTFAGNTLSILVDTILVLVYMFLFLYSRSRIKLFILQVSKEHEARTKAIIDQSLDVSRRYLAGMAAMIGMLWILYGIGFSIVGVENALFFAILCGLLEIIPFVGNITGTSVTVLAVVAQGGGSGMIIGVLVVYGLVQFIQTYMLEPLIVGEQVNINPLFTIMVLVLGELVWGIGGMVLAIPLLGILKIICDHTPYLQHFGYLIGTEKRPRKRLPRLRF